MKNTPMGSDFWSKLQKETNFLVHFLRFQYTSPCLGLENGYVLVVRCPIIIFLTRLTNVARLRTGVREQPQHSRQPQGKP